MKSNFLVRTIISSIFLFLCLSVYGQQIKVEGAVLDENNQPLIGASVIIDGTSNGVITDLDGRYSIQNVPMGSTLVCDMLGYIQGKAVADRSQINFKLDPFSSQIDEAVVVGYGVQRKESVVGAISQIKTEDLLNSGNSNITQAITGKLSGVTTISSSGVPGSNNSEIMVRGVSSWNGSAPLVMVDGVERDFSSLDPNEVENISVLKDASATAVFGAKGANGVILVTTRSGREGKASFRATVSHGFNFPTRMPEYVNAYETMKGYNVALKNTVNFTNLLSEQQLEEYRNPSSDINSLRYPDVNWYDLLMKKVAHTTDANINLSGGSKRVRYFISLGYKNEGSIFKEFKGYDTPSYSYNRLTYRSNLDFKLTRTTTLSFKVGGDVGIQGTPGEINATSTPVGLMYSASSVLFPAYFPEWALESIPDLDYPGASGERLSYGIGSYLAGNPYNVINGGNSYTTTTSKLYTDLLLNQKLDFITEGLSLKAKFSYSTYLKRISEQTVGNRTAYYINWDNYDIGEGNPWISDATGITVVEEAPSKTTQGSAQTYTSTLYWEASLNYDRTIKAHHVTGLFLFNQRQYTNKVEFPYRTQGLVGRVTYGYAGKYLVEANIGYTGSEQFSYNNRYGFFPAVAVGYVISEENFWKKAMPWWSKMKLRYSDGLVGNDQTASRWLYYSSYEKVGGMIFEQAAANLTAQWETAHKRDLGIEFGFFKNRLTAQVDLFDEMRTNMLVSPNVTILVGTSSKEANHGSMKKHGLEFELGWNDTLPCGVNYHLNAMFSCNENRILNYDDPPYAPDYQKVAGKPYMSQTNGSTTVDSGYFTSVDDIHGYSTCSSNWNNINMGSYKYLDFCVDGVINANDLCAIQGSSYPASTFSFGGGLKWKGLEFSFLFYGNIGKYVTYNKLTQQYGAAFKQFASRTDYWTPTNQDARCAAPVVNSGNGHVAYTWAGTEPSSGILLRLDNQNWLRADYISLRDVYLGYTFDLNRKKGNKNTLCVYATGNNLFFITPIPEGNPDLKSVGSGYPVMAVAQIGIKLGF